MGAPPGNRRNASPADIGPGVEIDAFKILRLLGRGGMGEVYLARDTSLGRKVALKLVRRDALGDVGAVERFLQEAKTTARFSHPHIVTVYAVGEYEGSPYVALEYIEGSTLRERIQAGRVPVRETIRIGIAIASGLREAHRHKVLHRDLKPENVLLPADGRTRVVDFGIAKTLRTGSAGPLSSEDTETFGQTLPADTPQQHVGAPAVSGVAGTPHYMAPEQWLAEECTPAVDVWALGVVLFELLSGDHPYGNLGVVQVGAAVCSPKPAPVLQVSEPLPARLEELVAACMSKAASGRPSAGEVEQTLRAILDPAQSSRAADAPPFRGLLAFTEQNADMFFGRDEELTAFLARLALRPVLPVVGPSGAGKSSFVQAGVVPRLREQERWVVLQVRPGRDPFAALAARVLRAESTTSLSDGRLRAASHSEHSTAEEGSLARKLLEHPGALALQLIALAEASHARVLLFVDQLEEVCTLVDDVEVRTRFLEAVCRAADDVEGPVRVVLTLRDDFLGRIAESAAARDALGSVTVLRSPDGDALKETISRPLQVVGYDFDDPKVLDEMIDAVRKESAALPLLQFAALALWQGRDRERKLLLRACYEEIGGIEGVLARQADKVLEGLSPPQVGLVRELFLRLVTPERTRRIVTRAELLEGLPPGAAEILDRLVDERLVLSRKAAGTDDASQVEIVHESLITRWSRLARWIEESREEVAFLDELRQAAELWRRRGARREEVWSGDTLRDAVRRAGEVPTGVPALAREFLEAGKRKERGRQRARRLGVGGVLVALAAIAVVAVVMAVAFRRKERDAVQGRAAAVEQKVETLLESSAVAFERGDPLQARAKLRMALEARDSVFARGLWAELQTEPLLWDFRAHCNLSETGTLFWQDGEVFTACNGIYSLDGRSRSVHQVGSDYLHVANLPGRRSLAAFAPLARAFRIVDPATGTILAEAPVPASAALIWLAASPGGDVIAAIEDDDVALLDATSLKELRTIRDAATRLDAIAFSRDGGLLIAVGQTKIARAFRVRDGVKVWEAALDYAPWTVASSPTADLVATGSIEGDIRILDQQTGALRKTWSAGGWVQALAFHPNGSLLASANGDHAVTIRRVDDGAIVRTLTIEKTPSVAMAFDPTGRYLAVVSDSADVRAWDLGVPASHAAVGHDTFVVAAAFTPDGQTLVSADYAGALVHWGPDGRPLRHSGRNNSAISLAINERGNRLAVGEDAGHNVVLESLPDGAPVATLRGHLGLVIGVAFAQHDTLASLGRDGLVLAWDAQTGAPRFRTSVGNASSLDADRTSPTLAVGSRAEGKVWLLDSEKGVVTRTLQAGNGSELAVRFTPDGRYLAVGSHEGGVWVFDLRTFDARTYGPFPAVGSIQRPFIATDASSTKVYAAFGPDLGFHVIDLPTGTVSTTPLPSGDYPIRLSPDGTRFVVSGGSTPLLLDVRSGALLWRSSALLATPPVLHTHLGWTALEPGALERLPGSAWKRAVESSGQPFFGDGSGGLLCTADVQGALDLWDLPSDRIVHHDPAAQAVALSASRAGCAVQTRNACKIYDRGGLVATLSGGQEFCAVSEEGYYRYEASTGLTAYDMKGHALWARALPRPPTSVVKRGPDLFVGFNTGQLLVVAGDGAQRSMRNTPASGVAIVRTGPFDTLIAGFNDGTVGVWDPASGRLLRHSRVAGDVSGLVTHGSHVTAASAIGDHVTLDLDVLGADYCTLLREVWQSVPVVWAGGDAVATPPPRDHLCSPR